MVMKRLFICLLSSTLLLSSCDTYTGTSAYAGGSIGSVLGSAIGGLAGGPRGSDIGTLIGMAGGAAVGAVIGSQSDQASSSRSRSYSPQNNSTSADVSYGNSNDSYADSHSSQSNVYPKGVASNTEIFDSNNSGDDRLYDFQGKDYTGTYSAQKPTATIPDATVEQLGAALSYSPVLEIVNARFVDSNEDNTLNRNETCKLIFEVMNHSSQTVYDVVPTVIETTGNKHIFISPSVHVETINPGSGIRYTAMIKADNKLKSGMACFCVSVIHEGKAISKVNEFNIPTKK